MWRVLIVLSILSVNLGRSVAFCGLLPFKNPETQKQGWKKTYLFLVNDRSDRYLSQRPVYLNFIRYITMPIIVYELHYINSYGQLKYGLLIRKSLDPTR